MTTPSEAGAALAEFGIGDAVDAIRAWLLRARWFGGRGRSVRGVELDDVGVIRTSDPAVLYTLWRVEYDDDGGEDVYSVLLGVRAAPHPAVDYGPDHLIATVGQGPRTLIVYDALADPEAARRQGDRVGEGGQRGGQSDIETAEAAKFDRFRQEDQYGGGQ